MELAALTAAEPSSLFALPLELEPYSLLDLICFADFATLVIRGLDIRSLCALASVDNQWRGLIRNDECAWRERARSLGFSELPAGVSTWRSCVLSGWSLRPGDCLEVYDTHHILSVCRVMATLNDTLLIHFEGWGDEWFFWLHRVQDRARIGRLTSGLPGLGSKGAYNEATYREQLRKSRERICAGHAWACPAGCSQALWPWLYSGGKVGRGVARALAFNVCRPEDARAWLATQSELTRPFLHLSSYAQDDAMCQRSLRAALFLSAEAPMPMPQPSRLANVELAQGLDGGATAPSLLPVPTPPISNPSATRSAIATLIVVPPISSTHHSPSTRPLLGTRSHTS
ncbi:hypothetical protein T492DRAFT_1010665 [Pavlovales sp. CCMP2436]|nr:hypothetical protein T492DRAFT_1010665 [Pavlovales sp. CCMP2436]